MAKMSFSKALEREPAAAVQLCVAALTCIATLPQPAASQASAPLIDAMRTLLHQRAHLCNHDAVSAACAIVAVYDDAHPSSLLQQMRSADAVKDPGKFPRRSSSIIQQQTSASAWEEWQQAIASAGRLLKYLLARFRAALEQQTQQLSQPQQGVSNACVSGQVCGLHVCDLTA